MVPITLISLVLLFLIVSSDFNTRQIPLKYLLGETIVSLLLGFDLIGPSIVINIITNLMIVTFQILILLVWSIAKNGSPDDNLWSKFGKGDLFMLVISAINLSVLNYLFFTILLSITSIAIFLGFKFLRKTKEPTIPFAGFLAAGLMVIRIFVLFINGIDFYSDNFLLSLIYGIY